MFQTEVSHRPLTRLIFQVLRSTMMLAMCRSPIALSRRQRSRNNYMPLCTPRVPVRSMHLSSLCFKAAPERNKLGKSAQPVTTSYMMSRMASRNQQASIGNSRRGKRIPVGSRYLEESSRNCPWSWKQHHSLHGTKVLELRWITNADQQDLGLTIIQTPTH